MIEGAFSVDRLAAMWRSRSPDRSGNEPLADGPAGRAPGRLCGLDPARGMLNQARRRADIAWLHGDLSSVGVDRAFELVVTTGHAFHELTGDDEIRAALAAVRAALVDGGRFAFETRNARVRGWERWETEYSGEVIDAGRALVRRAYRAEEPVEGGWYDRPPPSPVRGGRRRR